MITTATGEEINIEKELGDKKSFAGIPQAEFVDNVDEFMQKPENNKEVNVVLQQLDEQHSKYRLMEMGLTQKRRRLRNQIPDLVKSVDVISKLREHNDGDIETEFLLSEQVYLKARVPPTQNVCLWLGANVMLEYTLDDATNVLKSNIVAAKRHLKYIEHDLDFLKDQLTTTEVNMARVYNWDVKRRQALKAAGTSSS